MSSVVIVGAGAAGMMAAISAAWQGARVIVLERNPLPGRKLLITGKGRCNVTNASDPEGIIRGLPGNGRFLTGAVHRFSPDDLMRMLEGMGVRLKVERGQRVFPESDRSFDVVNALRTAMRQAGVNYRGESRVQAVVVEDGRVAGVKMVSGETVHCGAVIVATGGASYTGTGSTGDGYRFAKCAGHTVVDPRPALVPLEVAERWVGELQGLSLRNVNARVMAGGRVLGEEFGEMLFTHFGVSGPVVLSLSRDAVLALKGGTEPVTFHLDLKPALGVEQLDLRVQRDFASNVRKQFKNALDELLPRKLIPVMIQLSGIDPDSPVHQITREQRLNLVGLLKDMVMTITRPRPIEEAIVTAGGVNTKEVDPHTMESRLVRGLYFAGEVLDVDGYTGGFNLQASFSSGYVAGVSAAGAMTDE